jgi:hypothetical protein
LLASFLSDEKERMSTKQDLASVAFAFAWKNEHEVSHSDVLTAGTIYGSSQGKSHWTWSLLKGNLLGKR